MLMKIGDVTNKFGISHRSLHYWENVGILESLRGENDYRYYDEENTQKIKQIVLLRKLRLSIPSIQEIFTSGELSKVISVFTSHLDESKKEKEQLNALGLVLQQLIHMLKDKQNIESVYKYLLLLRSPRKELKSFEKISKYPTFGKDFHSPLS
ncbi:MerR family transcriptional regulator, partial [Paenibacillus sp. YN15]|uniref:MerR family transcriptional regulator n=1 Tax=Paenibacillus sp. YN15 TaxID=1742774 RepID=UPI000DCD2C4F